MIVKKCCKTLMTVLQSHVRWKMNENSRTAIINGRLSHVWEVLDEKYEPIHHQRINTRGYQVPIDFNYFNDMK